MIILHQEMRAKREKSDEVMAALAAIIPGARATEGVIKLDIARDLLDRLRYGSEPTASVRAELRRAGLSDEEIDRALGVSRRRSSRSRPPPPPRPESRPASARQR